MVLPAVHQGLHEQIAPPVLLLLLLLVVVVVVSEPQDLHMLMSL